MSIYSITAISKSRYNNLFQNHAVATTSDGVFPFRAVLPCVSVRRAQPPLVGQFEHLSRRCQRVFLAGAAIGGGTAGSIGDSWPPTAGNAAAVGAAMWYCLEPSAIIAAAISASGKGSSAAAAAPSPLLPPPAPAPMAGAAAGAAGAAPSPLLPGWQPPPPPAPMAGAKPPTAGAATTAPPPTAG